MPIITLPFYSLFGSYGLLFFNLLNSTFIILLIFNINRLFFNQYISCITAAVYAATTLFLNYTYNYSPDIFAANLFLGALYLIFVNRIYLGVGLLGLSIFAKISNLLPAAAVLGYLIWTLIKTDLRGCEYPRSENRSIRIMLLLIVFLGSLIPFAYTNYYLFGSPFTTGYQKTAIAGKAPGEIVVSNHVDKFNQSLFKGSVQLLFHPKKGIVPTNPVLVLAFFGLFLIKKHPHVSKLLLLLSIGLIQFCFFARYDEWYTSHFSNRFLMVLIALSSVFASLFGVWVKNRIFLRQTNFEILPEDITLKKGEYQTD